MNSLVYSTTSLVGRQRVDNFATKKSKCSIPAREKIFISNLYTHTPRFIINRDPKYQPKAYTNFRHTTNRTQITPLLLNYTHFSNLLSNTTKDKSSNTSNTTTTTTPPNSPNNNNNNDTSKQSTALEVKTPVQQQELSVYEKILKFNTKYIKPLPGKIWHEIVNVWNGSKLLFYEVKICTSFIRKVMNGQSLSRREKRQLLRTFVDLLRLVPFVIILVVPFLEFALPFLLKLFPNMLPSTFVDSMKKEEQKKQQLKVKLEVANFLQQAVHERARSVHSGNIADEFAATMEKVRHGASISNEELVKFATFFEDEFTLDNLSHEQLVAMCKYMQLNTIGTSGLLRYQLKNAMKKIKNDDRLIESEGVESLTLTELQQACAARGLKGTSRSKYYLQSRLREWLDLSLTRNLPISLLILANAFKITAKISPKDALREALYHLPESLVDEIQLNVSEAASASKKLEVLKKEEEKIKQEQMEAHLTEKEIERERLLEWILQKQDIALTSVTFSASQLKAISEAVGKLASEATLEREAKQIEELKTLIEKHKKEIAEFQKKEEKLAIPSPEPAPSIPPSVPTTVVVHPIPSTPAVEVYATPSSGSQQASSASASASSGSASLTPPSASSSTDVSTEKREEEAAIPEEVAAEKLVAEKQKLKESKSIERIEDFLADFVKDLEEDLQEVRAEKLSQILDKDKDGVVSVQELKEAVKLLREQVPEEALTAIIDSLDTDQDGKISLEELKPLADSQRDDDDDLEDTPPSSSSSSPSSSTTAGNNNNAVAAPSASTPTPNST